MNTAAPAPPNVADTVSHETEGQPARVGRWRYVLAGLLLGIAISQAFGFWGFLTTLVHGLPLPENNATTALVRTISPEGYKRVASRWQSTTDKSPSKHCISLSLPNVGIAMKTQPCSNAGLAGLKAMPGVAPRNHRLALAAPLTMTFGPLRSAPVAGWAARIGGSTTETKQPVTRTTSKPQQVAKPTTTISGFKTELKPSNEWATISLPEN